MLYRANSNIGDTDKSKVGILLVGHGQPDEWDIEWATETEQELSFRYDVLAMLDEDGFQPENLSLAWMEFKEPKPAEMIAEFSTTALRNYSFSLQQSALMPSTANTTSLRLSMRLISLKDFRL